MELVNATRMVAGFNLGLEPSGRELLVVVVKGTFTLPREGQRLDMYPEQLPLTTSDTFTGEPGLSAPLLEVDYAPRKHFCDVLLSGAAYAPDARPVTRLPVGIRIGDWQKTFSVVGDRVWRMGTTGARASDPKPFTRMPISYDFAFGGRDVRHPDPEKHAWYAANPAGRGFHRHLRGEWVDGSPLPNTEETGVPVTRPDGDYRPMALGPLGRSWPERVRYAGTYDQRWLDDHFPFLPPDFDERYYQAAPADQQIAFPVTGRRVVLANLSADGRREFDLPAFDAPVTIFPKSGPREELKATADTIAFEPDEERFTISWRVARPLRKSVFEIGQILIGRPGREWWLEREHVGFPIRAVADDATQPDDCCGGGP